MSIRFDAAADRLTYTGSLPPPASGMTITAWVKIVVSQLNWSAWSRLYDSGSATVGTFGFNSSGVNGPGYYTSGGSVELNVARSVGVWYPVAVSHNVGTTGKVYVRDTGITTTASGTTSSGTPAGFCIGGRHTGDTSEWFNGEIAQVRVWSRELSQAEIEAEWASPTPVSSTNIYANWPLKHATDLTDTVASRVLTTPNGTGQTNGSDDPPNAAAAAFNLGFFAAI